MWLVTSVCLYIYMSLVYESPGKCFWVLESPGNFSEQKSGNPVSVAVLASSFLSNVPMYLSNCVQCTFVVNIHKYIRA